MRRKYSFKTFNRSRKRYGVRFNNKKGHELLIILGFVVFVSLWDYFWYIAAAGFLILAFYLYGRWSKKQAIRKSGIKEIDIMDGIEFEKRLEVMFGDLGYKVKRTPPSGDYGADLVLDNRKGRTVVQAKRYNKPVGVKGVQEVIGAISFYRATMAIVVTNAYFTPQAEKLALCNGVELWNRDMLFKKLSSISVCTEPILVLDPAKPILALDPAEII